MIVRVVVQRLCLGTRLSLRSVVEAGTEHMLGFPRSDRKGYLEALRGGWGWS